MKQISALLFPGALLVYGYHTYKQSGLSLNEFVQKQKGEMDNGYLSRYKSLAEKKLKEVTQLPSDLLLQEGRNEISEQNLELQRLKVQYYQKELLTLSFLGVSSLIMARYLRMNIRIKDFKRNRLMSFLLNQNLDIRYLTKKVLERATLIEDINELDLHKNKFVGVRHNFRINLLNEQPIRDPVFGVTPRIQALELIRKVEVYSSSEDKWIPIELLNDHPKKDSLGFQSLRFRPQGFQLGSIKLTGDEFTYYHRFPISIQKVEVQIRDWHQKLSEKFQKRTEDDEQISEIQDGSEQEIKQTFSNKFDNKSYPSTIDMDKNIGKQWSLDLQEQPKQPPSKSIVDRNEVQIMKELNQQTVNEIPEQILYSSHPFTSLRQEDNMWFSGYFIYIAPIKKELNKQFCDGTLRISFETCLSSPTPIFFGQIKDDSFQPFNFSQLNEKHLQEQLSLGGKYNRFYLKEIGLAKHYADWSDTFENNLYQILSRADLKDNEIILGIEGSNKQGGYYHYLLKLLAVFFYFFYQDLTYRLELDQKKWGYGLAINHTVNMFLYKFGVVNGFSLMSMIAAPYLLATLLSPTYAKQISLLQKKIE